MSRNLLASQEGDRLVTPTGEGKVDCSKVGDCSGGMDSRLLGNDGGENEEMAYFA